MKCKNKYGHLVGLVRKDRVAVTLGLKPAPDPPTPVSRPRKTKHRSKRKAKSSPNSDPGLIDVENKSEKKRKREKNPDSLEEEPNEVSETEKKSKPAKPRGDGRSAVLSMTILPADDGAVREKKLKMKKKAKKCKDETARSETASNDKDADSKKKRKRKQDKEAKTDKESSSGRKRTKLSSKTDLGRDKENATTSVDAENGDADEGESGGEGGTEETEKSGEPTTLRDKLLERINSARFRYINEQLYTKSSAEAAALFAEDAEAFQAYHSGYQAQLAKWPHKPLSSVLNRIRLFSEGRKGKLKIADFGCGEARLAFKLGKKHRVHSFDFVALNSRVTAADMAKVPLEKESMDVGVFCLSLMGANLGDYLREANRVLRTRGILIVAEIASRLSSQSAFRKSMEGFGFRLMHKSSPNEYFVLFEFSKTGKAKSNARPPDLTPCLYKKR